MYEYRATLARVVDGDTVDLRVDLGFYTFVETRFRLARIDAPEVRGSAKYEGLQATEYLLSLLMDKVLTIRTEKGDKYGRWIAEIIFDDFETSSQVNVSDSMVQSGHAVYKEY